MMDLIGRGTTGVVYACYDHDLERKVAIKVLRVQGMSDQEAAKAQLLNELGAVARVSHPNIAKIHDIGHIDNIVYVVMEFVRGVRLDVWLATPRPWKAILSVFLQAGRALAEAHRFGLSHRDFKAQNIIIDDDGNIKVLDFTVARAADGSLRHEWLTSQLELIDSSNSDMMRPLVEAGLLHGTPASLLPEQIRDPASSAAADLFAFCVALYQCLYGTPPFPAIPLTLSQDEVRRAQGAPTIRTSIPRRVFQVLHRGMEVDPQRRFRSMNELLVALERAAISRRVSPPVLIVATLVAAAALGFVLASIR